MVCSHYKRKLISLYFDRLTNYYNRNFLEDYKPHLVEKGVLEPFFVMMADLKNLKKINMLYGHATGDTYIKAKSEKALHILEKNLNLKYKLETFNISDNSDVQILMSNHFFPIRYGGDEFLYIVYNKPVSIKELLRTKREFQNNGMHFSYVIPKEDETLEQVIAKAGLRLKKI